MKLKRLLVILIVLALLGVGGLYLYVMSAAGEVGPSGGELNPQFNYSVSETGVVDYGESGQRSMYVAFSASGQDLLSLNSTANQYQDPVPTDIYVLDYPCIECNGIADFKAALESELRNYSLIAQNSTLVPLKINQLERLGKKAIIIVPTGRMPSPMFDRSSDANVAELMSRGSVIIYVGNDFSQTLNRDGIVEQISPGTADGFGLAAAPAQLGEATLPYLLESGFYRFTSRNITSIGGIIAAVRASNGSGYFIAFPNTIDIGWSRSGGGAAGVDVARVIREVAWQQPLSTGSKNITAGADGIIPDGAYSLFTKAGSNDSGYLRLFVSAEALNGSAYYQFYDLDVTGRVTGRLKNTPFGVNGSIINLGIHFDVNSSDAREFEAFMSAYKDLAEVDRQSIGIVRFINVSDENRRYTVNLAGGDHVMKIEDVNRKVYAQSFLHIPEVTIESTGADWNEPAFAFTLLSDGIPVPNTPVKISTDGKGEQSLVTDADGSFRYSPGFAMGFGDHNFTTSATGRELSITVTKPKAETFFDKPQNQLIIVGIILVGILAVVLQRAEVPVYFIDIPDFPPQQKERIPLPKATFTNLIETLNREYRWKYMPLTAQEVKRGMQKRVTFKGKPILISDYNLEKLLNQLVDSGDLSRSFGLYGLKGWEKLAGKDARYLAVFRALRNFFINSAMLFTDVGQRQDCDILVNHRGENLFIHIYTGDDTVKRALVMAHKGKNFIVFASLDELKEFSSRLAPSATRLAVALKMEMDSRQVTLIHLGALGALVGKAA